MRKPKTNVGALSVRNTKKNLPNCAQKGNKGITLVALILTIVVLLILAVVAIRAVQGDGILSHAKNAQTKYNSAQEEEQINIALNEWKIAQNLPGNTKTMDGFLNEKLAGIGANVTDFDKYVQITMPSNRTYKIDKTTNKEYVPAPALNPSGTIPEGATYTTGIVYGMGTIDESNATKYTAGQNFPETLTPGDRYEYGDYTYYYECAPLNMGGSIIILTNPSVNGWNALRVNDTTKSSYGAILESVNRQPVTSMSSTFSGCTSLTTAPTIPSSVTSMANTFEGCTSLTTAPTIPSSVTFMSGTFLGCTSLTTAPTIPSSVTDMSGTFNGCTSLTTAPTIPSSVTNMGDTFNGCTSLTTAPTIPSSVTLMIGTFLGCTSLTTAPTIPSSVTSMERTFSGCTSLTTAPTIPSSVKSMVNTFSGCTSLKGNVEINTNPDTTIMGTFGGEQAFNNCAQDEEHRITITGSASQETKDALKATGYNNGQFISIE